MKIVRRSSKVSALIPARAESSALAFTGSNSTGHAPTASLMSGNCWRISGPTSVRSGRSALSRSMENPSIFPTSTSGAPSWAFPFRGIFSWIRAGSARSATSTFEVLTNFERYRRGTLEFFCEIFGVTSPKNGINGSKVGEYFKQGRLDEIAHYCLADCKATGELYQRLKNYYR
jgi:hypothetical protein